MYQSNGYVQQWIFYQHKISLRIEALVFQIHFIIPYPGFWLMNRPTIFTVEEGMARLEAIMTRRCLRLNPYAISGKRLLEIVYNSCWGDDADITQMVVLRFTRLKRGLLDRVEGIYMRVGPCEDEVFVPAWAFLYPSTASDTLQPTRSIIGKRPIRNERDIEYLEGKTVFVSRIIRGRFGPSRSWVAYRMHRLYGKPERDVAIIRQAMCEAKIEMLERLLAYPYGPFNLRCPEGLFDYQTRITRAIEAVRSFHLTTPPES